MEKNPFLSCSDSELITQFRAGSEPAYVELISRYTDKAYNLAVRLTRCREDAEEVLQDVFVTVYRKIDKFQGKSAFSSWLYRITVNTALMMLRKRKQRQTVPIDEVAPNVRDSWNGGRSTLADIEYLTTKHELREMLEKAVSRLPDDYRKIFLLRDVDGLSNHEVGEILSLSVPAVKSRLHRSRLMLRKKLKRFYEDYNRSDIISYGPGVTIESLASQP